MPAIVTSLITTSTDKRRKTILMESSFSLADIDFHSMSKLSLLPGDPSVVLMVDKLFICSVSPQTLIQFKNENNEEFEINVRESSVVLPFSGLVTITNPVTNPITLPATVSYLVV